MAATFEPGSPSRLSSSRSAPFQKTSSSSQSTMYDLPIELSTAQLEAKSILSHLLGRLKDPESMYHERYGRWVQHHPRLEEFCFRCVRPQIWTFLGGRWSLDALKAVGGDLRIESRGVYFNSVLGLDRKVRIYIGQANSIRPRIGQHLNFRHRRDNPSLHYHAMQQSIYNCFGLAALLPSSNMGNQLVPGMDKPELLLNVLEMWMCLLFRTLPPQTLEAWLPNDESISKSRKEGKEGGFAGLNIACPLDQGQKNREWLDLTGSDDPLVRDYLGLGRQLSTAEHEAVGRVVQPQKETEVVQDELDTPAARRKIYAGRASKYNKYMNMQNPAPSQALGLVFALGIGIVISAALLRTVGGRRAM